MDEIMTSIIPIRHRNNASNWDSAITNLIQTLISISKSSVNNLKCIIIVSHVSTFADIDSLKKEVRFKPDTKIEYDFK